MRPVTKVLLVLGVVALAGGAIYLASREWGTPGDSPAKNVTRGPAVEAEKPARPSYSDPLATYERWKDHFSGGGQGQKPAEPVRRPERDLKSSSVNEGTVVAHRSEEPIAGADPPGPVLRPGGVEGEVVTNRWKPKDAAASNVYTVVSGDTLYGIALKFYGDPRFAQHIEAANPGLTANSLRAGAKITLPERERVEAKAPAATPSETPAPGKVYVVQRNDTLIGIARRFYGDASAYRNIFEANQDVLTSPQASLRVGMRLRMPE